MLYKLGEYVATPSNLTLPGSPPVSYRVVIAGIRDTRSSGTP
jgi:hypothetical protein